MGVTVSVLTPSMPERDWMLEEAKASVRAQMVPHEHLVRVDRAREGCARTVNRLAERAAGDWLFILADDDLMLPNCLPYHLQAATLGADVVYAPPLVWGAPESGYRQRPPAIPSAALILRSLWQRLGGYDERLTREEDRDLWTRAVAAGARFVRFDEQPTWVYRIHRSSKSWAGMEQTWAA